MHGLIFHAAAVPDSSPRPIAFFAHERGDARVAKRISAFQEHGREVIGFMFHREREKADVPPGWENIHLGTTYNRRYFHRLWALARSIGVLWSNRGILAKCEVIYVVNTDNAVLALVGRMFAGTKAPLVLELADIQPAMCGNGVAGVILRAVERMVLRRSALLVTTSPGFVREYFHPVQEFAGDIFLLENKVYPGKQLPPPLENRKPVHGGKPWVLGCFGAFRCRRSMLLMRGLAERLGDRIEIVLRGYASGTITDDFYELLGDLPNFRYGGAYEYPGDLSQMYAGIDLNWAFDEADPNGNSRWLLPNRIYEGGCFGIPVIGSTDSETGRWIEERALGWTFSEPLEENLATFFETLDPMDWQMVKSRCIYRSRGEFIGDSDYARLSQVLLDLAADAGERE